MVDRDMEERLKSCKEARIFCKKRGKGYGHSSNAVRAEKYFE